MKSLGSAVSKVAAPVLGRRGFGEAQVVLAWRSIVGASLAYDTLPLKLAFARNERVEGVLHLRVAPGAAPLVQHLEPAIVERVNSFFGYRAVARLAIRQGPVPVPERARPRVQTALPLDEAVLLDGQLASVKNDELRAALAQLGASARLAPESESR